VRDEDGLVTIAGGKLTTWRTMAIDAVNASLPHVGRSVPSPATLLDRPLPGGSVAVPDLDAVLADEMPRHAEDVVFRRLPIGHDPRAVRRAIPDVIERMSARFGWEPARARAEHERVTDRLDAGVKILDDALGR
jgi:glycerol-3-phosphate dehydrogenase